MGFVSDNLALLSDVAGAIALAFGSNCEVVLHDLTLPYNKTIVAIWNGHVTGRKVGDGGTNAGLEVLRGSVAPKDQCYINTLENGKVLRSTSKYFHDEYGKVTGSLCINFDITGMLQTSSVLSDLVAAPASADSQDPEFFTGNIDTLLEELMNGALDRYGKPVEDLSKDEKIQIVNDLDKKGFFLVKKSTEKLADFLGLSRFTIYNYLKKE